MGEIFIFLFIFSQLWKVGTTYMLIGGDEDATETAILYNSNESDLYF